MDFPPNARDEGSERPSRGASPFPDAPTSSGAPLNSLADHYPDPHPSGPVLVASEPQRSRAELWAQRLFLLIFVVFCIWIGLLLVVLPWMPGDPWSQNGLLVRFPALRNVLRLNFVRGAASGLGLIDIWIGLWQAVHYREK